MDLSILLDGNTSLNWVFLSFDSLNNTWPASGLNYTGVEVLDDSVIREQLGEPTR